MANEVSEATTIDNCIKCGKSLEGLKRRSSRKFCSDLCRTRHFALKRYYEIKNTPEYKAKRSAYEKKWREENKEKWNERMKKASKKYRDKKKLQSKTPTNESAPGQPAGEREITPAGQGAMAGQEGNDQPSICACGHDSNNHSYDPENLLENNLSCDICDCTNFKKQSSLPHYQNNTAFVGGMQ